MLALPHGGFCAIQLDGASAVDFTIPNIIIPTTSVAASISAIVNPTSSADSRILSFGNGTSSNFCVLWGRAANKFSCFGRTSGAALIQLDSNDTYTVGTTHNVICTAQQLNLSIYVDGVFEGSNATLDTAQTFGNLNTNTRIGAAPGVAAAFLTGTVDDVRVYNRILSASDISTLGKSGSRVLITNFYGAYWPLDNGSFSAVSLGTDVLDRSGNGHNGVSVVGTPKWTGSNFVNYP